LTTFADRENAIEAHYAILELGRFHDRLHRYKGLGLMAAGHLGLHGPDAEAYAVKLAERCIAEPDDRRLSMRLAIELAAQGLYLSPNDIGRIVIAGAEPEHASLPSEEPRRSWVGFVMAQLMMLFGMSPTSREAADEAALHQVH
jgi:hypothetical protein